MKNMKMIRMIRIIRIGCDLQMHFYNFCIITFVFFCLTIFQIHAASLPNILIAISDDQSYPHASAYGFEGIETPAFDRVARSGVLFKNAFTPSPGCSPMRAALLTGRNIWQLEEAGTHASSFPKKFMTFPDALEKSGYFVGFTGKGWGPGNWKISGRIRNPAGNEFSERRCVPPTKAMSKIDYAANFEEFLSKRSDDQPFCFWFGSKEPHRRFEKGSGIRSGKSVETIEVPPFLPDHHKVRSDLLDYFLEIEWFDKHLGRMLDLLKDQDELQNTLVIVTSDNGMAFPRAKANVYEFGIHMPLAIAFPSRFSGKRIVSDLVNLIDVTATIYEVSKVSPPFEFSPSGRSLMNILLSDDSGWIDPMRDVIYSARERHSSSRFNSLGYPQRCIRTREHLYIWNVKPKRFPAGAPRKYDRSLYDAFGKIIEADLGDDHGAYHDIDACPSLDVMIAQSDHEDGKRYLKWATSNRPEIELYDIQNDPGCLKNLADHPDFQRLKMRLKKRLHSYLLATGDARIVDEDGGDVWETYPRYSGLRWFPKPDWARAEPPLWQDWLELRRPKK